MIWDYILGNLYKRKRLGIDLSKKQKSDKPRTLSDAKVQLEGTLGHYGKIWKTTDVKTDSGTYVPEWEIIGGGSTRKLKDAHLTQNDYHVIKNSKEFIKYQLKVEKAAIIKPHWVRNETVVNTSKELTSSNGKGFSDRIVRYYFDGFNLATNLHPAKKTE